MTRAGAAWPRRPFPESAMSLSRRHLLGLGGVATAAGLFGLGACSRAAPAAAEARPSRQFEVMHSDAEWRQRLTPAQYAVLRQQAADISALKAV